MAVSRRLESNRGRLWKPIMCLAQLHIGGLVAVGLDSSGRYLLAVSHSGRGVFDTCTWRRVARDFELAYPVAGKAVGIGPIEGQLLDVTEIDYETSLLANALAGNTFTVSYAEGVVTIKAAPPPLACDQQVWLVPGHLLNSDSVNRLGFMTI